MIIDIIIADNSGKPIHHFIKNLEDGYEMSPSSMKEYGLQNKFKDFLAQYLSGSGQAVRDKLIPSQIYMNSFYNYRYSLDSLDTVNAYTTADISKNNTEFTIRIDGSKVFNDKLSLTKEAAPKDTSQTKITNTSPAATRQNNTMVQAVEKYELTFYTLPEEAKDAFD